MERDEQEIWGLLDVCDTDPDAALTSFNEIVSTSAELQYSAAAFLVQAVAYGRRGIGHVEDGTWTGSEFKKVAGLSEGQLGDLEMAMWAVQGLLALHPEGTMKTLADQNSPYSHNIDLFAFGLESYRPGRAQEILGITKLRWFGTERFKVLPQDIISGEPLGSIRNFVDTFFSFDSIARSALVVRQDSGGIWVQLFEKSFAEQEEDDETFGDARPDTSSYDVILYDDGRFTSSVNR